MRAKNKITIFTEEQLEHTFLIAALTLSMKEKGKTKAEVSGAEVGETEIQSEVFKIMVTARLLYATATATMQANS